MTKEEIEKLIEEHAHSNDFGCRKDCDCAWCTSTKVAVALRHLLSVNERLTEALKVFAKAIDDHERYFHDDPDSNQIWVTLGNLRHARAALEAA